MAFFTIRGCYKTGTALGAVGGLQLSLKETQSMVWSEPRSAQMPNMWQSKGCYGVTLGDLWICFTVRLESSLRKHKVQKMIEIPWLLELGQANHTGARVGCVG